MMTADRGILLLTNKHKIKIKQMNFSTWMSMWYLIMFKDNKEYNNNH